MSDTPRLTRRQLREMGKLEARPAEETGLDETGELRLDRPSRRQLRMQELERMAAENHTDPQEPLSGEDLKAEPDSQAVDPAPDTDAVDADTDAVDGETEAPAENKSSERKSVFDRFQREPDAGVQDSQPDDVGPDAIDEEESDRSLNERLIAMTARNRTDYEQEPARLRSESGVSAASAPSSSSAAGMAAPTAPTAESISPESPTASSASDPQASYPAFDDVEDVDDVDDDGYDDEDTHSKWKSTLGWVLLLLIGSVVGFLIGNWISNNYLATPEHIQQHVVAAAERLL